MNDNGWILVTDKLPRNNENVLICGTGGGMYVGKFLSGRAVTFAEFEKGNKFAYFHHWQDKRYKPVKCIAWQPLPKPMKASDIEGWNDMCESEEET